MKILQIKWRQTALWWGLVVMARWHHHRHHRHHHHNRHHHKIQTPKPSINVTTPLVEKFMPCCIPLTGINGSAISRCEKLINWRLTLIGTRRKNIQTGNSTDRSYCHCGTNSKECTANSSTPAWEQIRKVPNRSTWRKNFKTHIYSIWCFQCCQHLRYKQHSPSTTIRTALACWLVMMVMWTMVMVIRIWT